MRSVTCFVLFALKTWWQIVILAGRVVVVVVVVVVDAVVVVVDAVVVVVLPVCWTLAGPLPANAVAARAPATSNAANAVPIESFFLI
jgi:hypothetical protein